MKTRLILTLAAALTSLGANALTVTPFGDGRFHAIHEGLAAEQVTGMIGKPASVEMRGGERHWIYTFVDSWGMKAIYDVTLDTGGHVERTSSMRMSF